VREFGLGPTMCVLCERAAAARLGLQGSAGVGTALALGDAVLPSNLLVDSANVAFSQGRVASDGVMDLYLHAPGGAVQVSGGGFGGQTIESVPIPQQDQDYIGSIVRRLDAIIDLDFRFVGDPGQADVAFNYDTEIEIGGGGQTLGLATTGSAGWELFVNQPAVASNQDYRQYVNLHEWGHALGLEHPFEAGDGDVYAGNTNPWTSAYPEETVMAYRSPLNGEWPDFFSTSDLNALIEIWGAETQLLGEQADRFVGGEYRDVVAGAAGNDELRGNRGFDRLEGGSGDDWLLGGPGADELFAGSGNDVVMAGFGHDTLTGGAGDDRLRGGYGGDLFLLSSGQDVIEDFRIADNDRLGLEAGVSYSLQQPGNDLEVVTDQWMTTLWDVDLTDFDVSKQMILTSTNPL